MKNLSAFLILCLMGSVACAETCTETSLLGFRDMAQKNIMLAEIAKKQAVYYQTMAQKQGEQDGYFVSSARKSQGIAIGATKTYEYASTCFNDKLLKINNYLNQ